MNIQFIKLMEPTSEIVESINRWENDPALIPLTRPNRDLTELVRRETLTLRELAKRLEDYHIYLMYYNNLLIGEMNYTVDPNHLFKKEPGSAWIGITIGEPIGRGKGIGFEAIQYMENQIKKAGLKRIELGVFEFNKQAIKLYQKLGYKEIGVIKDFTYWEGKMWKDIRMEKYL